MTTSDSFYLKQGDTLDDLDRTLRNADGTAIDLSTATAVRFHMRRAGTVIVDAAASVVGTASDGNVRYEWQSGDTDTPGHFQSEFEVTFASGKVITVPNDGFMPIIITEQIA